PDIQRTAAATGRVSLRFTTVYVLRPAIAGARIAADYAALEAREGVRIAANYATVGARAGARYADTYMVRPAAAAGLRQLKAFFASIDPPIRVVRTHAPRFVAQRNKARLALAPPVNLALQPETITPSQFSPGSITLQLPLRLAANDETPPKGTTTPP